MMGPFFRGFPKRRKQDEFRLLISMIVMCTVLFFISCGYHSPSWKFSQTHPYSTEYAENVCRLIADDFDLRSEEFPFPLSEKYTFFRRFVLQDREKIDEVASLIAQTFGRRLNFSEIEISPILHKGRQIEARRGDERVWIEILFAQPIIGKIALIIDDFGYFMNETTEKFLNFQTPMTYAIIPGNKFTDQISQKLLIKDKEVIVHMPLEPYSATTKDEKYLLKSSDAPGNWRKLLQSAWDEIPGAIGMNNHQGSKASENPELMRVMMNFIGSQKAFFVDSRTSPNTVGERIAKKQGIPTVSKTLFLDDPEDEQSIKQKFNELAALAKSKEFVLAIGHEKPITLSVLQEEIPKLQAQGYLFVPVSEVVK